MRLNRGGKVYKRRPCYLSVLPTQRITSRHRIITFYSTFKPSCNSILTSVLKVEQHVNFAAALFATSGHRRCRGWDRMLNRFLESLCFSVSVQGRNFVASEGKKCNVITLSSRTAKQGSTVTEARRLCKMCPYVDLSRCFHYGNEKKT